MKPENNVQNNVPKMEGNNGGMLNAGGTPGNKGGPGRPTNELRAKAREGVDIGIEFAKEVVADSSRDDRIRLDALDKLKAIGVPTQSEVIEIKDDQVIQWMYEGLGLAVQAGLGQIEIIEFMNAHMSKLAQR